MFKLGNLWKSLDAGLQAVLKSKWCGGSERAETTVARAQRIVAARRGWRAPELERRRKADTEKITIARRLRTETTMTWGWIAQRLAMGTLGYAADCLRKR